MTACGPSVWTGRALQAKNDDVELIGLVCIRPLTERLCSWPSWISARARSHSRLGREGHMGHLVTNALARPFSISSFRLADLGGKANSGFWGQLEPSLRSHRRSLALIGERRGTAAIPLVNLRVFISGCCLCDARLIAALLRQHGPGDPCQLVGGGRSQNVRMQAASGLTAQPVGRQGKNPLLGSAVVHDLYQKSCLLTNGRCHAAKQPTRSHSTSKIASHITATWRGKDPIPSASRAPLPWSPKTSTIRSEKPSTTFACSLKSVAAFTIPWTRTTLFTRSRLPSVWGNLRNMTKPTSRAA